MNNSGWLVDSTTISGFLLLFLLFPIRNIRHTNSIHRAEIKKHALPRGPNGSACEYAVSTVPNRTKTGKRGTPA